VASTTDLSGSALDGRYELHALIGEGAFGRVYRGLDRRLARPVAVKLIKPWWAEDDAWVERFQREARMLARVSDPGIVQIYDIGHADSGPYYVAELVDGESLAERLHRGALPSAEARAIGEQLCDALAGAHAQGIVHCDVKPANVLITAAGKVKVGDFGVARLAEGTSQAPSATVAGTPRYMSPEQARGRPTGPATDVYSAGVVIYEMLAGEPPFAHGSPVELGLRHVQEQPPRLPPTVPVALRDVVERALAKDPGERYRDGAAMAAALREAAPSTTAAGAGRLDGATPGEVAGSIAPSRGREQGDDRNDPDEASPDDSDQAATIDRSTAPTVHAANAATRVIGQRSVPRVPSPPRVPRSPAGHNPRASSRRRRWPAVLVALLLALGVGALAVVLALSAGSPPHVKVPGVVGRSSRTAESRLTRAGLRYATKTVAAPGSQPGVVTHQSPASATSARRGAVVALSVAETPRWRTLTSFSGANDGQSVPFQILGAKWRLLYHMSYEGTCTLLVVCFGPSAEVANLKSGSTFGQFELGEGETETRTFASGPGLYRLDISGGHDSARWSMKIEDYY
jgi:serine/threonine protein kinase